MATPTKSILITGAGLVGSLLSIYLRRRGYEVSIYERRGDMRKETVEAGRSINLALSDRGIKALQGVGIAEEVLQIAIPMHGRHLHQPDGSHAFQPYGKEGQYINSVSRHELNCKLLDLAEREGVHLHFHQRCDHVNWKKKEVHFAGPNETSTVPFDLLFGADGAYSATRLSHMLQHQKFDYQQYYIDCGYKELSIPAGAAGAFQLEKNALHIWPRGNYMLIALPNLDGSFTGTLFFPFEGETSFERLKTEADVEAFFRQTFPDLVPLVPDLARQFFHNPTSSLVTVKCFPWVRGDHFALIGDAAHAIVPFFGQGMNAGFEDCTVLAELMEQWGDDWEPILAEYQALRKPDGDAIADLAINNFTEMRARTADPKFLLQKKIEAWVHESHPDQWIPAYSQVTFSPHIRYSEALRNSQRQEAIMQEVMKDPDIAENWKREDVKERILAALRG
ncbi:FAD-dependent monooxygenase [Flaviaesturariibacter flavus]|uniref:Kynurenine 3-monooxygenase n=1 Tax=Flaviaesturariibacter flavus TaxID=2502780 RepID=A0A4R1BJJ0_9BACT|nr:NAD(P)/FAD-dependent oxidoreductase [Flaviaesturariibacter flavus]TCJ17476.1 FAD-dependent monooxygenase [Flaviaesturariibacter flavus]